LSDASWILKSVGAAFRANPSGGGGSSSGGSSSSGSSGGKSGGGALDLLALATLVLLSGRRAQRALVRRGC